MGSSSERNCDARNNVPIILVRDAHEGLYESILTCRWSLTKLHHLPKTDARGRERGIVFDGVQQRIRRPPSHDARLLSQNEATAQ